MPNLHQSTCKPVEKIYISCRHKTHIYIYMFDFIEFNSVGTISALTACSLGYFKITHW